MPPGSIHCNRCGFPSADDAQFCQRCGATLRVQADVTVVSNPTCVVHDAGFWIRVLAATIDTFLLVAVAFPARLLLGSVVTLIGMDAQLPTHDVFLMRRVIRIGIGIAAGWAYAAGMESSRYQATLGKMAMRLKVTDVEGRQITLARATARHFAKLLSAIVLGIGYAMAGFDEQKQALHDQIAGTLVMYRDHARKAPGH